VASRASATGREAQPPPGFRQACLPKRGSGRQGINPYNQKPLMPTGKLLSWAYHSIDIKALRAIDDILCAFAPILPAGRQA